MSPHKDGPADTAAPPFDPDVKLHDLGADPGEQIVYERPQIVEYDATAAGLAELKRQYQGRTYDLATTKGYDAARADRWALVKLRTALEDRRKELKAPALERTRLIDAEAARITAEIKELETPLDTLIKAEDERRAKAKAAAEQAERDRITKINVRIAWISSRALDAMGKSAVEVEQMVAELTALPMTDELYAEFLPAANQARAAAIDRLSRLAGELRHQEAEVARAKAERAALAEQKRQQAAKEAELAERERKLREAEKPQPQPTVAAAPTGAGGLTGPEPEAAATPPVTLPESPPASPAAPTAEAAGSGAVAAIEARVQEIMSAYRCPSADIALVKISVLALDNSVNDAEFRIHVLRFCHANLKDGVQRPELADK